MTSAHSEAVEEQRLKRELILYAPNDGNRSVTRQGDRGHDRRRERGAAKRGRDGEGEDRSAGLMGGRDAAVTHEGRVGRMVLSRAA